MTAYDENKHPRDPRGQYTNKPGTNGAASVSLSSQTFPQADHLREMLSQAQEILDHATISETRIGTSVNIPKETLEKLGFYQNGRFYDRVSNGVELSVSKSAEGYLDGMVQCDRIQVVSSDSQGNQCSLWISSRGGQGASIESDGLQATSFRGKREEQGTRTQIVDGPVDYKKYWGDMEYSYINSRGIHLRRDQGKVYKSFTFGNDETFTTQEQLDELPPNAFQTGYDIQAKVSDIESLLWD